LGSGSDKRAPGKKIISGGKPRCDGGHNPAGILHETKMFSDRDVKIAKKKD
jgi:hypothetical protein